MALNNDSDLREPVSAASLVDGVMRTDGKPGAWSRLQAAVAVTGAAMMVAIFCLAGYTIWDSRREALAKGESAAQTLAHVLEAQTRHAFATVELSLSNIESALGLISRDDASHADAIQRLLRSVAAGQPHVRAVFFTDEKGVMVHASGPVPAVPLDSSAGEYFRVHKFDADYGTYIGTPLSSLAAVKNFISVSRRISRPDGGFGGVAVAVIESGYFQNFYTELSTGKDGSIALFLRNGTLLFRGPPVPESIGKSYAGGELFSELLPAAPSRSFRASSAIDKIKRVFAYRAIDGLPLVVVVGISERELLTGWHRDTGAVVVMALAVTLVIMGLAGFLVREIGRREALTSSLLESGQRYRYLFEANPHPMWIYDTETLRFLAVNDAAARHYGYSRDEFFAMTIRDIRPPEEIQRIEKFVSGLEPALNESGVWSHRKKDGTVFDVEIVSHGFDFGGRPARLVQAQDISARTHAETELRASEERYRHLFEGNPIAIWVMDEESLRFLAVNQAAIDKYGYTRQEFLSLSIADMQVAEDRDRVIQQIRSRDAGAISHYLRRHVAKSGQVIDAEVTVHPFRFGGRQARMILINDVTETRRAQQALQDSEQRYRDLFELNPSPMWVYDSATLAILAVNEAAVRTYGYTRDEFSALTLPDMYPPEDVPALLAHVRQRAPDDMNVRQVRHRSKEGVILDVEVKSGPISFGGRVARLVLANDITERKRAEAARTDLAAIVESSNDAIISRTLEGTITSWNSGAERMFGYSAGEAIGRPVTFLLPEGMPSNLESNNQRVLSGEISMPHESRRATRDGRVIDVMVSHSPVTDSSGKIIGASVIFHDISALKRAEAALLRERTLLRTVIDNLPDRIYVKDSERRYLLVNQSDLKHRHLATDEAMLGKTAHDLLPHKYADAFDAEDRAVLDSGVPLINREFVMESDDGRKIWMMANKIPLRDAAGKIFGLVGIHRDITEVRRSAEAVIRLNAELEQRVIERTAQLEAANKELESFAYSVSHDLRAPLRSIDGFSKALMDDYRNRLDSTALDYLRRVRAASQRMALLIDDLLLLSRITRSEIQFRSTDLSAMAEEIVQELRRGQPQRQVDFSVTSGIRVNADPGLMRVALDNLLGNAWKFTGKQSRAVISVGLESRDGQPVYFIRDNGAGFDMKYADKLFGAFQRLHREADFDGTGVGLAIVQRIIQRHGGRIWAEAAVGKGATFFFTLGDQRG